MRKSHDAKNSTATTTGLWISQPKRPVESHHLLRISRRPQLLTTTRDDITGHNAYSALRLRDWKTAATAICYIACALQNRALALLPRLDPRRGRLCQPFHHLGPLCICPRACALPLLPLSRPLCRITVRSGNVWIPLVASHQRAHPFTSSPPSRRVEPQRHQRILAPQHHHPSHR